MAGSATLTAVESSPAMNEPMIAATSASCLRWLAGAATAIGPIDPTIDGCAYGRSKHAAPARRRRRSFPDGEPVCRQIDRAERPGGAGSGPGPGLLVERPGPGGHVLVQVVAEGRVDRPQDQQGEHAVQGRVDDPG